MEAPAARERRLLDLPHASRLLEELGGRGDACRLALFLDFDGTLAPIAPHPSLVRLDPALREDLARLAKRIPVAVVSGRALADVRRLVALDGLAYAGSHGFRIETPEGLVHDRGDPFRGALDAAERELRSRLDGLEGVWVERKPYAIAVHLRHAPEAARKRAAERVASLLGGLPELAGREGKQVIELRPAIDWDKGRAVLWLLSHGRAAGRTPLFIGDDVTDEDAFRAIAGRGPAVVVGGEDRTTLAGYRLADPSEVHRFLKALGDLCEKQGCG